MQARIMPRPYVARYDLGPVPSMFAEYLLFDREIILESQNCPEYLLFLSKQKDIFIPALEKSLLRPC